MQEGQYNIDPTYTDPATGAVSTRILHNYPDATPNVYWMTTGRMSNDNVLVNRGIEFDFDLGRIKPPTTLAAIST